MPVFVVRNATHGNLAYSNFSEGIGKVLRFGAYSPDVMQRLRWMAEVLAPSLKAALGALPGGIDLKAIQSQALLMGDEVHSRNAAATALFHMAIAAPLAASSFDRAKAAEVLAFIANTSQFFLNLSMVASKCIMDSAHDVENSSIVTAIARNGVTGIADEDFRWLQQVLSDRNQPRAVIVGSGGHLCSVIGKALNDAGARTVILDLQKPPLDWLDGNSASFVQCDVTSRSEVRRSRDDVMNRYGRVDILLNAAEIGRAHV